jgi:hypothetical protein
MKTTLRKNIMNRELANRQVGRVQDETRNPGYDTLPALEERARRGG